MGGTPSSSQPGSTIGHRRCLYLFLRGVDVAVSLPSLPPSLQLYSMYVGEGEAALRDAFSRARLAAPSILFFDELDSIVGGCSRLGGKTEVHSRNVQWVAPGGKPNVQI